MLGFLNRQGFSTASSSGGLNPLGMNLIGVAYFSTQQPFINLMKSGGRASGSGDGLTGWITHSGSTFDTAEAGYLQLDSDGYPTSLTASPIPSGGQKFTSVLCNLNLGMAAVAGVSTPYPSGTYRLRYVGQGTVSVSIDGSTTLTNAAVNTYTQQTFTVTAASGMQLQVTAIGGANAGVFTGSITGTTLTVSVLTSGVIGNGMALSGASVSAGTVIVSQLSGTTGGVGTYQVSLSQSVGSQSMAVQDHPRDISLVLNSLAASYDAGAIFNPAFLAAEANLSTLRFMDWMNQAQGKYVSLGSIATAGTAAMTLSSAWLYPTGTYPTYFPDGSTKSATYIVGSTSVTWSGNLGSFIGSDGTAVYVEIPPISWSTRSLPSNAFWSLTNGVPLEICVALCNQLSAHMYMTCPLTADDTYISNQSALVFAGTGMQAGFGPLNSHLRFYSELSNETWNGGAKPYHVAGYLGAGVWPTQASGGGNFEWNRNWYGMRCAQKAALEQTAWGASFTARCFPLLAGQAATTFSATEALAAPYWTTGTGAPSTYPIRGLPIAPYWGDYLSQADTNILTAQADGGLDYFFQLLTSNTVTGGANPGHVFGPTADLGALPSNGFLGIAEGWINAYTAIMSSYPGISLMAYEGGQNFLGGGAAPTGWNTLAEAAQLDARMATAFTTYLDYWQTNVGSGLANINCLYVDFQARSNGSWGILESVMQTISPLSSAPPKYQAVQDYIG